MISLESAIEKYGKIVNGVWPDESKFCTLLEIPDDIASILINSASGKPTKHIYCNKDMGDALLAALCNVRDRGLLHELRTFDGCLMVRDVRGIPGHVSTHAYALAVDLNAKENPLGGPIQFSKDFVQCFIDCGFIWGGTFSRRDGMHFQFAAW